jgi:hypothetical protein
MLVSYLTTTLGISFPQPVRKTSDIPFPCQDHPCGCLSAEDCWRHCCCFTAEDHLAWARANKVEPPSYAQQPATSGWRTARLRDKAQKKADPPSCCVSPASNRTCSPGGESKPGSTCPHCSQQSGKPNESPTGSCCQEKQHSPEHHPPTPKKGSRWGYGWNALRCQGLTTLWISAGAVAPPPPQVRWQPSLAPAGWLSFADPLAHLLLTSPPDPPPRPGPSGHDIV